MYKAIRCQCGWVDCTKWQVQGFAGEAKFESKEEAEAVAALLNGYRNYRSKKPEPCQADDPNLMSNEEMHRLLEEYVDAFNLLTNKTLHLELGDVDGGPVTVVKNIVIGIERLESNLIKWRSAIQELTPGGSEFMNPENVKAWAQQMKSDVASAKLNLARIQVNLRSTIELLEFVHSKLNDLRDTAHEPHRVTYAMELVQDKLNALKVL